MADATPEDRQKIVDLLKAGKLKLSPLAAKYFERAGVIKAGKDADFSIVETNVNFWGPWEKDGKGNQGGMEISWATESAGFGSLTVFLDKDGKLKAETEGMSKDFCMTVFAKLVESWVEDE